MASLFTQYQFTSKVAKIERKRRAVSAHKTGQKIPGTNTDEVQVEYEDIGWFLLLDGSMESRFLTMDKDQPCQVGDPVTVMLTIETTVPEEKKE